jgi:hypothetical protein
MEIELNEKYLITTDRWFVAPDGDQYRAVHGTVTKIANDNETLGIKTNRGSTNWFVVIGGMVIAGCQIHYAIKTDECSFIPPSREIEHDGKLRHERTYSSRIYDADSGSI